MLPGCTGEELLPALQGIPVIVVSAKVGVDDKVQALLAGAADYVSKPFALPELLARITAQLRKAHAPTPALLTCGDLTLDPTAHQVAVRGQPVKLTRTEYAICRLLLQNPGQVLAKSVILDRISQDTPDCTEGSLKQHMSNLRKVDAQVGGQQESGEQQHEERRDAGRLRPFRCGKSSARPGAGSTSSRYGALASS